MLPLKLVSTLEKYLPRACTDEINLGSTHQWQTYVLH